MRTSLMLALCLSACSVPAKQAGECLVEAGKSTLFAVETPAGLSASVTEALNAGKVAEAAAASAKAFDDKLVEIAKDPRLSEEWSKVVTSGAGDDRKTARTAHVASDLPTQATRLRTAGMSTEEVARVIGAAATARLTPDDMADLLSLTADAVEKNGSFADLGDFLIVQIDQGVHGEALTRVCTAEVEARGEKVKDKLAICHHPPGNPTNSKTLEVGASAVAAHLGHGDTEGPCADGGGHDDDGHDGHDNDKGGHGGKKGGPGPGKGKGKGKNK